MVIYFSPKCSGTSIFSPLHSDSVLDNDLNGYYDYLVINVGLSVPMAGRYLLYGTFALSVAGDTSLGRNPSCFQLVLKRFRSTSMVYG